MANDEHVALLKQGVTAWNKWRDDKWRDENLDIRPDLSNANGAFRHAHHLITGASREKLRRLSDEVIKAVKPYDAGQN